VKADRARALGIFEDLCAGGHRVACGNLDAMLARGWGLPKGPERFEILGRLCDKRAGQACHALGQAAASGQGVPRDAERAKALFTKGCDAGYKPSCDRM
jgi:TPR repeat protein